MSLVSLVKEDGCPVVGKPLHLDTRFGHSRLSRFLCAAVTIGLHVIAIPALFFVTTQVHIVKPAQKVLTVSLLASEPAEPQAPAKVPPTMAQPENVTVPVPSIPVLSAASASAITLPPAVSSAPSVDPGQLKNAWAAELIARLTAVKHYPRDAVAAHEEGVVWLRFDIDRAGRVLLAEIQKSSGFDALDKEAVALAYRAQPLPKPPAGLVGDSFDLVVPIRFALN